MVTRWACGDCGFALYYPIDVHLGVSESGLYSDARFPGRAIVAYRSHVETLEELAAQDLTDFWTDVVNVGRAVQAVTACTRINYAVLGNAQPHLHAHVIPRYSATEQLPTRPPWNDPRDLAELPDPELISLTEDVERLLRKSV